MAHPAEELNPAKKSALGKKFFVILAFLLVLGMLLLLISFAKYRKKINGEIRMPEAMKIQATLTLDKNLSAIESQNLTTYLANLQPGDNARDFLEDSEDTGHKIVVTITNHGLVGESATQDERTELTLHYKLYVDTTDHLPLEFIMVDGQGQKYIAKKTGSRYCFYPLNIDNGTETVETTEAEFTIAETEVIAQSYTIYVGWNNRVSGADDAEKLLSAQKFTNADYRKEVEMLTLRAEIVAETAGVGYGYESEGALQGTIKSPVSEP